MSFQWVDIHLHTTSSQCIYIYEAACTVHTNYTQGIGWTTQCMANDCAFLSVYIYTWWQVGMCERWDVWNPTRSRYTLGGIHTLPLTLGQRSSHTTRRPLPLVCPGPQPPSPTPVFSLFPLFSHGVTSFFPPSPFQIITIGQTFSSFTFFKTFKHISVGKKAGEINFIKSNTAD